MKQRCCTILSGVSGSGKSHFASQLLGEELDTVHSLTNRYHEEGVLSSADNYFMFGGKYLFDPQRLPAAHQCCFRSFLRVFQKQHSIVVDNTNTTSEEIAPYYLAAEAFGYEVEIITFQCVSAESISLCAKRNKHGVSAETIAAQDIRLKARKLLPWWKNTNIDI